MTTPLSPSSTADRRNFPIIPSLKASLTNTNGCGCTTNHPDSGGCGSNTSGSTGGSIDKENLVNRGITTPSGVSSASPKQPLAVRSTSTPATTATATTSLGSSAPIRNSSPSLGTARFRTPTTTTSTSTSTDYISRLRVLRTGETVESLFLLDANSSDEYRQLCYAIAHGGAANDASSWRRALDLASEQVAMLDPSRGSDLIRLHRRATSRFSDHPDQAKPLWLSFAQALARYGPEPDARFLLTHLQAQQLFSDEAQLYAAMAALEQRVGDSFAAERAIQLGLQRDAQPHSLLQSALQTISSDAKSKSLVTTNPQASTEKDARTTRNKRKLEQDSSPKRRKTERGVIHVNPNESSRDSKTSTTTEGATDKQSNIITSDLDTNRKELIRFQLAPLPRRTALEVSKETESQPSSQLSHESPAAIDRPHKTPQTGSLVVKSSRVTASTRLLRPPLLASKGCATNSNTPRLGKPARIDPSQPTQMETDDTDEDRESPDTSEESTKTKAKLTKLDLSYIFAWDPNKPSQKASENDKQKEEPDEKISTENKASNESVSASKKGESQRQKDNKVLIPSDQNEDFMALVSESNIIRVNHMPYAKLGVIGRGGSCKVYRALSKQYNVVAVKKVKLAGMDRRQIDGYSNEVALLKRLKGNPSIIQLFDSEIDLKRKSIFLVMELGEADLNYILQQHTTGGRQLNMNFIRLTWQQMLTAVHCIHEERIIHGDLKPANFLFVRGALKLIDFGIAKAIQSDDTTNIYRENQVGTLNYMSPEAILVDSSAKGKMKVGRASDIWSLGCILYQMVYGKTPFADLHMIPKLQAIVDANYVIDFPFADDLAIDAMQQCLQRKPEDRPPIVGTRGLLSEHRFLHG